LVEIDAVPNLISYLEKDNVSLKIKKAVLWILAKICNMIRIIILIGSKNVYGKILNDQYKILENINSFFVNCEDFAMKGTITYVICYISQNRNLRENIENLGWEFFFNSDICFPKEMKNLYLDSGVKYENKKYFDAMDKINKYILLKDVKIFLIF
jgi:hypothetical protein